MKGFLIGALLGMTAGAALGAFMTPGASKNFKALRKMMGKHGCCV